jgi:hypothetical protein
MEGERHPSQIACGPREILVQGSELLVASSRNLSLEVEKVRPGGKVDVCGTARSGKNGWEEEKKGRQEQAHPKAGLHPVSCISHRGSPVV